MAGDHKLTSSRVEVEDSIEAAYELVYEKGWTDGLPIIPPTEARVHKMLAGIDKDPSEVIAEVSPAMGKATVEKIAVNAVMAGCLPAYLPVIIAAIEAMTQPEFNLNAIQCTNNPVAPLAIVNGPAVKELDINGSYNCLGQGRRSNATIGRAIRFVLLNIGGGIPGTVGLATAGRPGKYSFCLAGNEDLNPWQPLHVERGFDKSVSTVTVVGVTSIVSVLPHSREPSDQLLMIAHSMALAGSNNFVLGGGAEVAAILSPTVASYAAQGGFSKEDVKRFLFENSKLPISYFAKEVQNNIIKDGRVADGMVDLVKGPEDIMVVVAGGEAGSHSVFAPTFGLTRAVTRPIRL